MPVCKRVNTTICPCLLIENFYAKKYGTTVLTITCPASYHLSPDPNILVEADGAQCGKQQLKAMSWPMMDDDGLPSSYVNKVLTCLSKWRVKMEGLLESLNMVEDPAANLKESTVSIQNMSIGSVCEPAYWNTTQHHITFKTFIFGNFATPRLEKKAQDIDKDLHAVSEKITSLNMDGILNGYKSEQLIWKHVGKNIICSISHVVFPCPSYSLYSFMCYPKCTLQ